MAVSLLVVICIVGAMAWSVAVGRLRLRDVDRAEGATAKIAWHRSGEPEEMRRRRAELVAIGEDLQRERDSLEREKRELAAFRESIERRRRQFPEGIPPAPAADDQFDVMVYNHRLERLHANIAEFNTRAARYRADIDAFMVRERTLTDPGR